MPIPTSVLNLTAVVGRNVVPVIGVLFLEWSAPKLILIYFADTLLTFVALFALAIIEVMRGPLPPERKGKPWTLAERIVLVVVVPIVLAAFIGFPLGLPVVMFGLLQELSWRGLLEDRELHWVLLIQVLLTVGFFVQTYRMVAAQPQAARHLRERFGFAFVRWIGMMLATYATAMFLPVEWSPVLRWIRGVLLVAVYAAATIYLELAPEKVLRLFDKGLPGEERTPPEPGDGKQP